MNEPVLVVGSAHVDVVGTYPKIYEDQVDKPGTVKFYIGGTGYNICIDLASRGVPVAFFSALPKDDDLSQIIIRKLADFKVSDQYVAQRKDINSASGYVAHMCNGQLVTAVSSMTIENFIFQPETVREAVGKSRLVVLECNLSSFQLELFIQEANRQNKMVVVACVSEEKSKRLNALCDRYTIDIVCLNKKEAVALFGDYTDKSPQDLCRAVCSRHVIITEDEKGYSVFSSDGCATPFPAPKLSRIVSTSGAGDALCSAVCRYLYSLNSHIDWQACSRLVEDDLMKILSIVEASEGATIKSGGAPVLQAVSNFLRGKEQRKPKDWVLIVTIAGGLVSLAKDLVSLIIGKP